MKERSIIKEHILREFIRAGGQVRAVIKGQQSGFALTFRVGDSERILATARGIVRLFASLDTASGFVRDLGIPCFEVDMTRHQPGRLRSARPDRAEALRRTRTRLHQQPLEFSDADVRV